MLDGVTVVVTGAANGIGRAIALEVAARGADAVVVADLERTPRGGGTPTDEMVSEGTTGRFVETDIADAESVSVLFETVAEEFGGLDVLVNNAAVFGDDTVQALDLSDWQLAVDVNLTGTFLCCKEALPLLLDSEGSIVNISSVAGLKGQTKKAAYCATKAGVTNLTRQIALDYAGDGLRANSVHPGVMATSASEGFLDTSHGRQLLESIPMDRAGEPEEVARVVAFLASDMASYVNGHALVVDGAITAKYY
jgi:NAD(P)-dependent dehydrogenase (short-subunit alcohol dehydrogenase family)